MADLMSYLESPRSQGNNMRMWTLLGEFIVVEKWACSKAFYYLFNNRHKTTTMRFLNKMVDFGVLSFDQLLNDSNVKPIGFYKLTHHGFGLLSQEGTIEDFTMIKKSNISIPTLIHSMDLQTLHAVCLNNGYREWQRPDYAFKEKGRHYSDAIAKKHNVVCAFELERYVKSAAKYNLLFSHYANEIFNGSLNRVFYVCPNIATANSIKKYFESVDVVKCGEQVFNTNKALLDKFSFVDYSFFGFSV